MTTTTKKTTCSPRAAAGWPEMGFSMRVQYCWDVSRETAKVKCPWACVIVAVRGGHLCFESAADYETWKSQK